MDLCAWLMIANFIMTDVYKPPYIGNLFQQARFFSSASVLGVLAACATHWMFGWYRSMAFSLTLSLAMLTGIMYLEDRNDQYLMQSRSRRSALEESRQFHFLMSCTR